MKAKIVSCHTADSKPVKQEVNGTMILPPLVFPGYIFFVYEASLIFIMKIRSMPKMDLKKSLTILKIKLV
jgi:hypothetical protein